MALLRILFSRELILLGLRDLRAHKLRSLLTALGVIFGVAAVICMLSIGEGASAETLQQIRLLGSHNIIIRSVEPTRPQQVGQQEQSVKKYGITRVDADRLGSLPGVADIVRMRDVGGRVEAASRRFNGAVIGTTPNFFGVVNLEVSRGRPLSDLDDERRAKVCIIGQMAARELFPNSDPIGQSLSVRNTGGGGVPYEVVGVLRDVLTAGKPEQGVAARDINRDVYIPLASADLRYGDLKITRQGMSREIKDVQLSDVYVHVGRQEDVLEVSRMCTRVMEHGRKDSDYTITVPLALLQEAERAKRTRQIVLGSIAGISLLVGGIGIMNIMLASVTERTREIGIRRALGAKRVHITAQFLVQTLMLSVLGGLAGILLGIGMAWLLTTLVEWQTIIPLWGVLLSFLVSALVGIVFGLYPARAAAKLNPIEALNSTARTA